MKLCLYRTWFMSVVAVVLAVSAQLGLAQELASISIVADREDHIYAVGENASLTISALDANGELVHSGTMTVDFANDRRDAISNDSFDLAQSNPVTLASTFDRPGFVSVYAKATSNDGAKTVDAWAGLAFNPEKIELGAPKPDDFDEFWAKGKEEVRAIPIDVQQEKIEQLSNENRDVYSISFATIDNSRVYGFLGIPKGQTEPCPAVVCVAWAGLGLGPDIGMVDQGLVSLVMNVFPYPCSLNDDERERQYEEYNRSLGKMYFYVNANDRENYFYRKPILGIDRAVDWLAEQPYVDSSRIGYQGISQGGGFGLILGGLNKNIDAIVTAVPAMCDFSGFLTGRRSGWPRLGDPMDDAKEGTLEVARYYDAANFAQNIEVPIIVTVGYIDQACSPSSVNAAFNAIPSKEKQLRSSPLGIHSPDQNYMPSVGDLVTKLKAMK